MCWFKMDRFVFDTCFDRRCHSCLFRVGITTCILGQNHGSEYLTPYGVGGLVYDFVSHCSNLTPKLMV